MTLYFDRGARGHTVCVLTTPGMLRLPRRACTLIWVAQSSVGSQHLVILKARFSLPWLRANIAKVRVGRSVIPVVGFGLSLLKSIS